MGFCNVYGYVPPLGTKPELGELYTHKRQIMGGQGFKRNKGKTPVINARSKGKRGPADSGPSRGANKRPRGGNDDEAADPSDGVVLLSTVDESKIDAANAAAAAVAAAEDAEEDVTVQPASKEKRVIVVLEEACLETVKSKSGKFELLNCDDHLALHAKLNRDPKHSRPDIAHQCLLTLLDSPLNKAGMLTVYLRSAAGVLIEISPHIRIPRTYKRFAGLMVQLLHDLRIRAAQGSKTLLKVIKNPVEIHLPANARKFGTSHQGTLVDVYEFVNHLPDEPVVFAFGAMAQGKLNPPYVESYLSFSKYPLSGSYALGRLLGAFEKKWGIV